MKLVQLNEDLANLSDKLKDKVSVALNDTEAQVALETDDKKKEVKKDTKPAVDSTNELAKKTNADGKAREIFESLSKEDTDKMLDALVELSDAFEKVSYLWGDINGFDDALVDSYPFDKSFDELANNVNYWVLDIQDKINNGYRFKSYNENLKKTSNKVLTEDEIGHSGEMVGEPIEPEEYGIDAAITDLIKRGWENVDQVNSIKATFESLPNDLKIALELILDDNMTHLGLLEGCVGKPVDIEDEEEIEIEEE